MGKTRSEELFYELYASSKQHDSWQRYAMIRELRDLMKRSDERPTMDRSTIPSMKATGSGSDRFERAGNDRMSGEIREGLVHKAIWEEKSIPLSKVSIPQSNSEILKRSEPEKVDLGLEKLEHVVMNEVDGDVEKDQKVMSDTKIYSANQLFDQMPLRIASKEKRRKSLKAWNFKFKPTSKSSRLMDDKFSFVDATVLLNRDPKKIIWDCVKKELKETMAACEKNRVNRFKLAEEKESKLQVLDLHQTFMCHQIGRVWEPGGLPNKMDLWDWFETELKACGESQQVERFLFSLMQVVKRNLEFKTFETNRVWECGELLATHVYHKWLEKKKLRNVEDGVKQDKNRFSGDVEAKVFMAAEELHFLQDVFELVKELPLKTSLVSPQVMRNTKRKFTKQWMFKFRKKKIDQWLGYDLMVTYLENQTTWTSRFDEEDQRNLQSRTENSLSRREISTFICQAEALLFASKEPVISANQEPAISTTQEPATFQSDVIICGDVSICPLADHLKPGYVVFFMKEAIGKFEQFSGLCKGLKDIDVSLASFYVWLRQTGFVVQQVRRNKKIRLSKRWWFKYKYLCYSFGQESFGAPISFF